MSNVTPIPEGFNSITSYLIVPNSTEALAFYEKAFGAVKRFQMEGPDGSTMHAEMQIGDSVVMMSDANPQYEALSPETLGGTSVHLHFYCEDVDAMFAQAIAAGCEVSCPLMDAFWGDRFGKVKDPFGHIWGIASRKEIVSEEEIGTRQAAWMKQMAEGGECCGE